MQHSMRALIGVMLVGWICCSAMAAESERKWWQFGAGGEADATVPPGATQAPNTTLSTPINPNSPLPEYSSTEEPERHWMISSPLAKVSWPRIHMPEMPKAKVQQKKPGVGSSRNSWAGKGSDPLKPSPMQSVKNGARRVGQSTRSAWDKTVDVFTPGDSPASKSKSSRVARRDSRDSREPFWGRMFGTSDAQQKQGSQTITEFMAQDRIDP
jgi:hypothetical protein